MATKHTPGPWIMSHQDPWAAKATIHEDNSETRNRRARLLPVIAEVNILVCGQGYEDIGTANARLIAAAPTMYEYIAAMAELGDKRAIDILSSINS